MADTRPDIVGTSLEPLALDDLYSPATKKLPKKPMEAVVTVMKDWDEATSRMAPFVVFGCTAPFTDYVAGRPVITFSKALNDLVATGKVQSFFLEPMRSPYANGYLLFCLVHMLPEDYLELKSKHPFLHGEGELPGSWRAAS